MIYFQKQNAIFKRQNDAITNLALSTDSAIKNLIREIDCSYMTQDILKNEIGNIMDIIKDRTLKNIENKKYDNGLSMG